MSSRENQNEIRVMSSRKKKKDSEYCITAVTKEINDASLVVQQQIQLEKYILHQ